MALVGRLSIRALLLTAITASAMLAVEYVFAAGTFCGAEGGCARVQASSYGEPFGIPLPFVGVVFLSLLFLLSLSAHETLLRVARWGIVAAGAGGAGLLSIQAFILSAFCPICVTVDLSVLLAGALASLPGLLSDERGSEDWIAPFAWVGLWAIALIAPPLYHHLTPPTPAPPEIERLYSELGVNVIEFADFTCPHCQALHPNLEEAIRAVEEVELARIIVPVTGHPRGAEAAKAFHCAEELGAGEAMADYLFRARPFDDSLSSWARAVELGSQELSACVHSEQTDAALRESRRLMERAGVRGLPTTFAGGQTLVGAVSKARLVEALEEASASSDERTPARELVVLGAGILAISLVLLGVRATRRRSVLHGDEG